MVGAEELIAYLERTGERNPEPHWQHGVDFMQHYLAERFHQGLGGQLIKSQAGSSNDNGTNGTIIRRSRLGGFLNYYHREAA
jgi:hypothetical protein